MKIEIDFLLIERYAGEDDASDSESENSKNLRPKIEYQSEDDTDSGQDTSKQGCGILKIYLQRYLYYFHGTLI